MKAPPRRFWTRAAARAEGAGWAVALDDRPLRTPAAAPFLAPTQALAEAVAAEWDAQGDRPDPAAMPLTRAVNTAIDRVTPHRAEVAAMVAAYGATDLVCFRAARPPTLTARQAALWDPALAWALGRHGARLICAEGVMPVDQPPAALAALRRAVDGFDPFGLTALHELTALAGSVVLGLMTAEGALAPDDAWACSTLDEDYQSEQWGRDAEAEAAAAARRAAFLGARRLIDLLAP